jgi:hypothetical protein
MRFNVSVMKAGYLLRTAEISGSTLKLTGYINSTTDISSPRRIIPIFQ